MVELDEIPVVEEEHRCFVCDGLVADPLAWVEMRSPYMPRRWFCPVHHVAAIRVSDAEITQIEFSCNARG